MWKELAASSVVLCLGCGDRRPMECGQQVGRYERVKTEGGLVVFDTCTGALYASVTKDGKRVAVKVNPVEEAEHAEVNQLIRDLDGMTPPAAK
jgi:hypothetical protein